MLSHTLFLDALFCEEEHFEPTFLLEQVVSQEEEEEEEAGSCSFLKLFRQESLSENEELRSLLYKEEPHGGYHEESSSLAKARREVVEWMLKVIAYYSFSSLTALLAVTYFHRFLNRFLPRTNKPWMIHLAAVACLSLAAKVDETDVPLLLDIQVEEPRYFFKPKDIQKMEILVLSTLEWKMNPVTPISFLDYIARRLALKPHLSREFLTRCERLLLSLVTDSRFMCHLPSAMATAAMLYVITNIEPSIASEHHDQLLGILGINKDRVRDCCALIQELVTNVGSKRKLGSLPCSPKGVFDLSFASDSSNDSWAVEPPSKKITPPKTYHFSKF